MEEDEEFTVKSPKHGIVPERVLKDKNLSFVAKGIYALLSSNMKRFGFDEEEIEKWGKEDKEEVASAVKELIDGKYIIMS